MIKKAVRVVTYLAPDQLEPIEQYRERTRLGSTTAAIRQLLDRAIAAVQEPSNA